MKTMSKEERCTRRKLQRNSGQIFEKSAISQITRRTWIGRSWVCRNGQIGTRTLHLQVDEVRVSKIFIKLVSSTQQFRNDHSTWLSRCTVRIEKSLVQIFGSLSKTNPTTRSRPSTWRHQVFRNIPSRSSSRHENWVEILDIFFFFFKLEAEWSMVLERVLIKSLQIWF